MARTKYTPDVVDAIIAAIRAHGGDREGWEAGQISDATFYVWQNQHPEFRERVAIAKREYKESRPIEQRIQARRALNDYLFGRVVEVWESHEEVLEPDGSVSTKTSRKEVKRGVPQWVIERILGKDLDVLEAIKMLIESQMAPEKLLNITETAIARAKEEIKEEFNKS